MGPEGREGRLRSDYVFLWRGLISAHAAEIDCRAADRHETVSAGSLIGSIEKVQGWAHKIMEGVGERHAASLR
jgi:hypothetical protein